MITPAIGCVAVYREDGIEIKRPLAFWREDEDGNIEGYVVTGRGRIWPAPNLPGFWGYGEPDDAPIVAAIPGAGWRVRQDSGWESELVGWAVDSEGWIEPIVQDGDASASILKNNGGSAGFTIWHPTEKDEAQ